MHAHRSAPCSLRACRVSGGNTARYRNDAVAPVPAAHHNQGWACAGRASQQTGLLRTERLMQPGRVVDTGREPSHRNAKPAASIAFRPEGEDDQSFAARGWAEGSTPGLPLASRRTLGLRVTDTCSAPRRSLARPVGVGSDRRVLRELEVDRRSNRSGTLVSTRASLLVSLAVLSRRSDCRHQVSA